MRDENNIEELFQSSFEDFEMTPPDSVKKGIDHAINGSRYRRVWWVSLLIALIGGGALIAYLYVGSETPTQEQLAVKSATHPTETAQDASSSTHLSKMDQSSSTENNSTLTDKNSNLQASIVAGSASKEQIDGVEKKNSTQKSNQIGKANKEKKSVDANKATTLSHSIKSSNKKKKSKGTTKKTKVGDSFFPSTDFSLSTEKKQTKVDDGSVIDPLFTNDVASKEDKKNQIVNPFSKTDSDSLDKKKEIVESPEKELLAEKPSDSSETEISPIVKPTISKPNYWMASLYAGPQFGLNSKGNDPLRSISEKTGSRFSVELNRTLFRGYGVTTGFGYGTNSESYRLTQLSIIDSIYIGQDSTPIYDMQFPDSIIGYNYFNSYSSDTTKTESTQLSQVRTIGIPLFVTRQFMFSEKWGLLVNAGAVFNFYKVTPGTSNGLAVPTINDLSINVAARLQLTYKFGNWMLSAGVNGGWDMKPALMYQGLDRKRYFLTPQIGLHFTF